jgi:uncharacterized repeat protein (TIGR03803 family)
MGFHPGYCEFDGCGTVFKLAAGSYSFTVLHSFASGLDGGNPWAPLIVGRDGALYGTTEHGGTADHGTIFAINRAGHETVIYSFQGGSSDGSEPEAPVIFKNGDLYGLTSDGGAYGEGTIFKLSPTGKGESRTWTESVLHSFGAPGDGAYPNYGGLTLDSAGNFYGTTGDGGRNHDGTLFKLAADGSETVLRVFHGTLRGIPLGGVIVDRSGAIYGTSFKPGTVFQATPDGMLSTLHKFGAAGDGEFPECRLLRDAGGTLFGTTVGGGSLGGGTVFELHPDGRERVMYSFPVDGGIGWQPIGGLIMGKSGELYGTTFTGGASAKGTVFVVTR